ncbi:MAG TPA: hypothetical protein VK465_12595 [Fibrobacteria bacterium]|nr:hypothetical protein [Fibrobacteria bacterium]
MIRALAAFSISAIASMALLAPRPAEAAPRDFAIGVVLGSPTGLSVLQNLGETEAVQAALEFNLYNTFVAQADYLFKLPWPLYLDPAYGKAWLYYGPGVRWEWGERDQTPFGPYRHSDEGRFAVRFPVGVQYYVPKLPFDLFFELGPMLSLWEATTVDATAAFGARFNL